MMTSKKLNEGKISEGQVRMEMLDKGALLLHFDIERPGGVNHEALRVWRAIEKKGFLVTKAGCLIPAPCHCYANSNKKPAYDTAMKLFWGKSRDPTTTGSVNVYMWPSEDQVSHLCHDNACCCYKDLEIVPQWQNLKRNYCGFNGVCDCSMIPACKSIYRPSNIARDYDILRYGDADLGDTVRSLLEVDTEELRVKVKILESTFYKVQDMKRANRNTRIKRKKRHDTEHDRKAKRQKKTDKKTDLSDSK